VLNDVTVYKQVCFMLKCFWCWNFFT